MKKKIFYLSLITNVVLALVLFSSYYFLKNASQSDRTTTRKAHQERRKELFEILSNQKNEVVMLGDGLIEEGNWSELLQNPKVHNRGIRGDGTADIVKRIREVVEAQPAAIYLYIGGEDLTNGLNPIEILQGYEKILTEIKISSPATRIWAQSILPTNFVKGERTRDNASVQAFNQKIEALCARFGAKYLNLYNSFVLDNQLNGNYTNDGLHLNAKGYQVWAKVIQQNTLSGGTIQN